MELQLQPTEKVTLCGHCFFCTHFTILWKLKKEGAFMAKYKKRKDGRYCTKIDIGRDPETGKRKYQMVYGKTIAELEKKKSEVITSLDRGLYIVPNKTTFGDYKESWYNAKCIGLEMHTKRMYRTILNNYLIDLEDKLPKEITKSDIQKVINDFADKPRTCEQIKLTLNQIFESGIDDGLLYKNPCRNISLPKRQKTQKRPLTRLEDILSDVSEFDEREGAFVKIIKYCGLRKEEALALTKDDIDFTKNTIKVNKALVFSHNRPIIKDTKSKAGMREIPMPIDLSNYLHYYISTLDTDYLFYNLRNNCLITEQGYRKMWGSILEKMKRKAKDDGLDYEASGLTAHIFRHNYATMLYYAGIGIKEAQKLLGHSSISMTMDIYTHLEDSNDLTTQKLNTYLTNKRIGNE